MTIRIQVETLNLTDLQLGTGYSKQLAKSVFRMTKLKSLELNQVKLDDKFFSTMCELAPESQVYLDFFPSPHMSPNNMN